MLYNMIYTFLEPTTFYSSLKLTLYPSSSDKKRLESIKTFFEKQLKNQPNCSTAQM